MGRVAIGRPSFGQKQNGYLRHNFSPETPAGQIQASSGSRLARNLATARKAAEHQWTGGLPRIARTRKLFRQRAVLSPPEFVCGSLEQRSAISPKSGKSQSPNDKMPRRGKDGETSGADAFRLFQIRIADPTRRGATPARGPPDSAQLLPAQGASGLNSACACFLS